MKLKSILAVALCAVGMAAFAAEPDAVQLWADGPYWATVNVGDGATVPGDYGELYAFNDNKAADAAESLGDGWRLPTQAELDALSKCTKNWETSKDSTGADRAGYRFTGNTTGYTDKSIFLPAAGYDNGFGRSDAGNEGHYWSSEVYDDVCAWFLVFREGVAGVSYGGFGLGLSVRAVRDTPPLAVKNVISRQRYPWNGLVDVACDLTGAGLVALNVTALTNGVVLCEAKTLIGETTVDLDAAGGVADGVKLIWNAAADLPAGFKAQNITLKVTVEKLPPPPPPVTVAVMLRYSTGDDVRDAPLNLGGKNVPITNGAGSFEIAPGTYDVRVNGEDGLDAATISPKSVTIEPNTSNLHFTVEPLT